MVPASRLFYPATLPQNGLAPCEGIRTLGCLRAIAGAKMLLQQAAGGAELEGY